MAWYADASWQAHRAAAVVSRAAAAAPVYPGVSWYLLADAHDQLRQQAREAAARARQDVWEQARQQHPRRDQAAGRRRWYLGELQARDIPLRGAQVPRGVIAQMAIDARRSADTVCPPRPTTRLSGMCSRIAPAATCTPCSTKVTSGRKRSPLASTAPSSCGLSTREAGRWPDSLE